MGKRHTSNSGIPEKDKDFREGDGSISADSASSSPPAVSENLESETAPAALKVVSQPDEAELETDSSARSIYEFLSDRDVEDVQESSELKTAIHPSSFSPHQELTKSLGPQKIPADNRIGQELSGRYVIERLIGKGGMGRVYLAKQTLLNRMVAIKILNRSFQNKDPQFSERFYLEAATAARLNHPNSITVFDYGESDKGELYIVMEYLKGQPLSRIINRGGPLTPERTIRVALHLCRALRAAHKLGIIHRDLKPGNIMLLDQGDDPEMAKVLDFGLVKLFQNSEQDEDIESPTPIPMLEQDLTHAGMFLGSPKYMSPEQIQNSNLDPRTDIYSLGIILFYMLAGRQPFVGKDSIEIVYQHIHSKVPTINEVNQDVIVPDELEDIVRRCLEKKREKRFASMSELLDRLLEVLASISNSSTPFLFAENSEVSASASGSHLAAAIATNMDANNLVGDSVDPSIVDEMSHSLVDLTTKSTANFFIIVLVSVLLFGGGAYFVVINKDDPKAESQAPSSYENKPSLTEKPKAARETSIKIEFRSKPSNVHVHEGKNLLGKTPFTHEMMVKPGRELVHTFLFSRPGYKDREIERTITDSDTDIFTELVKSPKRGSKPRKPNRTKKKSKSAKPVDEDEDYKDNPY